MFPRHPRSPPRGDARPGWGALILLNLGLLVRLLGELARSGGDRTARFRTVCVALHPDGREWVAEGVLEGSILETGRGTRGFGYDPVVYMPDRGLTMAQLPAETKHEISHRGRAARAAE
jgi:XTP/dITP diphosphohydrolase